MSSLSMIGSIYIVQDVLRNPRKRKESIYHRLMLGLSIFDILSSFSLYFLTSWPQPEGHSPFSFGTLVTCDATGFIATVALIGASIYNCSLAIYFLVEVKYNWTKRRVQVIEKWLHIVPWTVATATAVACFWAQAYGPFLNSCW